MTYNSSPLQLEVTLDKVLAAGLSGQIMAALNAGPARGGTGFNVVSNYTPGQALAADTDLVMVSPEAAGRVALPVHGTAIVFSGDNAVEIAPANASPLKLALGGGSDTVDASTATGAVTVSLGQGHDLFIGARDATNVVDGGVGDDTISGGAQADLFRIGQGADQVEGGEGFDTVIVAGALADYVITTRDGQVLLTAADGTRSSLSNVQMVAFDDGAALVGVETQADGAAARLFDVILGRAPDPGGMAFVSSVTSDVESLAPLVQAMLRSSEFTVRHGPVDAMSDSAFLTMLYVNGLGRPVEQDAMAYWLDQLARGTPREMVAVQLTLSPESELTSPITYFVDPKLI